MIDKSIIEENISSRLGVKTELFDIIHYSTNDRVKELIKEGQKRVLVVAKRQEGGRGRVSRSWISTDESLAISFSLNPNVPLEEYPKLAPLIALAVTRATCDEVSIKWPNDILLSGKKVSGILCELFQSDEKNYVIVGIGINIKNNNYEIAELSGATSLFDEGITVSKESLITNIYNSSLDIMKVFEREGFKPFMDEYNDRLSYVGEEVKILDSSTHGGDITLADTVLVGTCLGVNESGELLIKTSEKIEQVTSGELSLRKA